MKKISVIICLLLVLSIVIFSGCTVEMIDNGTTAGEVDISANENENENAYGQYPVTQYELSENAFEISGELKKYTYNDLENADTVIDRLDEFFETELVREDDSGDDNGYANWSYDEGDIADKKTLNVSVSSKTGKFSLYFKPHNEQLVSASKMSGAEEEKLLDTATSFVERFSAVTGELTFECSVPDNSLFYPIMNDEGSDSEDVRIPARKFWFYSEQYSKQKVKANDELDCPVECGSEDAPLKNVQYFCVTVLADGTVVFAENCITKADISESGTWQMFDEKTVDKLISLFISRKKDDKLIISRIYVDSYSNYFGSPNIVPEISVEYCFESSPEEVKTEAISSEFF